eukprot:12968878-Alexandrium_andersonii.AAC.1
MEKHSLRLMYCRGCCAGAPQAAAAAEVTLDEKFRRFDLARDRAQDRLNARAAASPDHGPGAPGARPAGDRIARGQLGDAGLARLGALVERHRAADWPCRHDPE